MMSTYSVGEFAKIVGVSVRTLQRWDREGVLIADRTLTNRRVYTEKHLSHLFQQSLVRTEKLAQALRKALGHDPQSPDTSEPNA